MTPRALAIVAALDSAECGWRADSKYAWPALFPRHDRYDSGAQHSGAALCLAGCHRFFGAQQRREFPWRHLVCRHPDRYRTSGLSVHSPGLVFVPSGAALGAGVVIAIVSAIVSAPVTVIVFGGVDCARCNCGNRGVPGSRAEFVDECAVGHAYYRLDRQGRVRVGRVFHYPKPSGEAA